MSERVETSLTEMIREIIEILRKYKFEALEVKFEVGISDIDIKIKGSSNRRVVMFTEEGYKKLKECWNKND